MKKQQRNSSLGFGLIQALIFAAVLGAGSVTLMTMQKRSAQGQKYDKNKMLEKVSEISSTSMVAKVFSFDSVGGLPKLFPDPYIIDITLGARDADNCERNRNFRLLDSPGSQKPLGSQKSFVPDGDKDTGFQNIEVKENNNDEKLPELAGAKFGIEKVGFNSDPDKLFLVEKVYLKRKKDSISVEVPVEGMPDLFDPDCTVSVGGLGGQSVTASPGEILDKHLLIHYENDGVFELHCKGLIVRTPSVYIDKGSGTRSVIGSLTYNYPPGSLAPLSNRSLFDNKTADPRGNKFWEQTAMLRPPICCGSKFDDAWYHTDPGDPEIQRDCELPSFTIVANVEGVKTTQEIRVSVGGELAPGFAGTCTREMFYTAMGASTANFPSMLHDKVLAGTNWGEGNPYIGLQSLVQNRAPYLNLFETENCQHQKHNGSCALEDAEGNCTRHHDKWDNVGGPVKCIYQKPNTQAYARVPASAPYWPQPYEMTQAEYTEFIPIYALISTSLPGPDPATGLVGCESKLCGVRGGPSGGLGCFSPDSLIYMYDGSLKRIDDIRPKDELYNPITKKKAIVDYLVQGKELKPMIEVHHKGGSEIVTKGHPFLTSRGLVRAEDLRSFDMIIGNEGNMEVELITPVTSSENDAPVVWNILVNRHAPEDKHHMILTSTGLVSGDLHLQLKINK